MEQTKRVRTWRVIVGYLVLAVAALPLAAQSALDYPQTRKGDRVDDYHGTKVADPYRWLEDDNSSEAAKWVQAVRPQG